MKAISNKVIGLSFFISATVLILLNLDIDSLLTRRHLETSRDKFNSICYNSEGKLILNTGKLNFNSTTNTSFASFVNSLGKVNSSDYNFTQLNEMLFANTQGFSLILQTAWNLLKPYIIFLACFLITPIVWITYCCCCCCPCFCCKNTSAEEPKCGCKLISFVVVIISIIGVIAVAIAGFIISSNMNSSFVESECAIFNFFLDLKEGENKTTTPKWIGVDGIMKKFNDLSLTLDSISSNVDKAFENKKGVNSTQANDYYKLLQESYTRNQFQASNPNSDSSGLVTPGFVANYGPWDKEGTQTNIFANDFDVNLVGLKAVMDELEQVTRPITDSVSSAKSVFTAATDSLKPLSDSLTSIDSSIVSSFSTVTDIVLSYIVKGFLGVFAGVLGLNAILLISTLLYSYKNIGCLRILAHFMWNLLIIINLILFLVASLLGVVGTLIIIIGPFLEFVFQSNNINSIISDKQAGDMISTCVNGNGDLKSFIVGNSDSDMTSNLEQFYDKSSYLQNVATTILDNKGSYTVKIFRDYLDKLTKDISLDLSTGSSSGAFNIKSLNDITNYNQATSFQDSDRCSLYAYDLWVGSKDMCPFNFLYVPSDSSSSNFGKNSCLVLSEWDPSVIASKRYNDCAAKYSDTVSRKQKAMASYLADIKTNLNSTMYKDLNGFDDYYYNASLDIRDVLQAVTLITKPMTQILGELSAGGLFDLVNCRSIGDDLIILVNSFDPVGVILVGVAICLGVLALLNWLHIFFALILIFRTNTFNKANQSLIKLEQVK